MEVVTEAVIEAVTEEEDIPDALIPDLDPGHPTVSNSQFKRIINSRKVANVDVMKLQLG